MERNYLNTKTGLKTLLAGLFLFGTTLFAKAQCTANFNYSIGSNGSVSFANTSTGTSVNTYYSWSFGDSSFGFGPTPTHVYTTNGPKTVCLTIVDSVLNCTSVKCDSVFISNVVTPTTTPCNANFNYVLGPNGLVSFANTSTGTSGSTMYSWSFGGSGSSSATNPSHTFATNGPKYVCLTITNSVTACSSTKCDSLFITSVGGSTSTPCAPTVVYTLSKDSTTALTWNAYPSYPPNVTNATWYWGDGSSSTGLYPSHTYSAAGTYSTCVTVSVSCGTVTATYCYVATVFRSNENNAMILINVKQALPTGIKNPAKAADQLSIYPNPNNGEFIIELNGAGNELKENTVCIYNMIGEKVVEKHVLANGKQTIDVSNLANGTYLVKINSDGAYLHKKITIQK